MSDLVALMVCCCPRRSLGTRAFTKMQARLLGLDLYKYSQLKNRHGREHGGAYELQLMPSLPSPFSLYPLVQALMHAQRRGDRSTEPCLPNNAGPNPVLYERLSG